MSSGTVWSDYARAYKAIFDAAQGIASVTTDVTKLEFTWNPDGSLATLKAKRGDIVLYTLIFEWNPDGTLKSISRT